jgi:hypothetical protein
VGVGLGDGVGVGLGVGVGFTLVYFSSIQIDELDVAVKVVPLTFPVPT